MIPPRIFTIHNDGGGVEYLNESQLGEMELYKVNEQYRNEKIVRQYTLEVKEKKDTYLQPMFTRGLNLDKFGLPEGLTAQKTKKTLVPYYFPGLKHRVIE